MKNTNFKLLIVAVCALSFLGWVKLVPAMKLADDPPKDAESDEKEKDPFAVPEGDAETLLKFIEGLKRTPLRPTAFTPEGITAYISE